MLLSCLTDHAVWGAGWWRQPPADPANPGRATDCGSTVRPERIHPASPGGSSAVRRRPTDPHTTAAFRGRRRGGLSASPTGHTDSRRTNPNLSAHSGKVLCKVFLQKLLLKFLGACHGQSMIVTAEQISVFIFWIEECFSIDEIWQILGGLGLKIFCPENS